jgi:hypothetical protein
MTNHDFALICAGLLTNGLTFALGVAVGISLTTKRKDSRDDHHDKNPATYPWHQIERRGHADGAGRR